MNYDGDVRWWRSCLEGFTTSHLPGAPPPRPEVCCYGVHDAVFAAEHVAIRCARFLELFGRHYFAQRPRGLARPARAVTDRQEGQRVAQRVVTQRKQSFRRATLCARARHSCCSVSVTNVRPLALASRIIRVIAGFYKLKLGHASVLQHASTCPDAVACLWQFKRSCVSQSPQHHYLDHCARSRQFKGINCSHLSLQCCVSVLQCSQRARHKCS